MVCDCAVLDLQCQGIGFKCNKGPRSVLSLTGLACWKDIQCPAIANEKNLGVTYPRVDAFRLDHTICEVLF